MLAQEVRTYFRNIQNDLARSDALRRLSGDKTVLRAVLTAPAFLSGLGENELEQVRIAAAKAADPDRWAKVETMRQGWAATEKAVAAAVRAVEQALVEPSRRPGIATCRSPTRSTRRGSRRRFAGPGTTLSYPSRHPSAAWPTLRATSAASRPARARSPAPQDRTAEASASLSGQEDRKAVIGSRRPHPSVTAPHDSLPALMMSRLIRSRPALEFSFVRSQTKARS